MKHPTPPLKQAGFTLVELLVGLVIITVLFALSTVNLGRPQTDVTIQSSVDTLLSDIKSQQLLAMSGDEGSTTSEQPHGIFVEASKYTLYTGATFSLGDSSNYVVNAPANTTFSSTLPSGKLLFNKGPGDVSGLSGSSTYTITVAQTNGSKVITINRFGALN